MTVNRNLVAVVFLFAAAATAQEPVDLEVKNTTVVDPASRRVLVDHSVYIAQGRIVAVEPHRLERRFVATKTIDGANRFLIPGLLDMHVHISPGRVPPRPDLTLPLLLSNGVTSVRDMASDCWQKRSDQRLCLDDLRRLAHRIEIGEVAGPRLVRLSSAVVRGAWERDQMPEGAAPYLTPKTAVEGRQLARYLNGRPVDLAKTYNTLGRDAYFGSNSLRLRIRGHARARD